MSIAHVVNPFTASPGQANFLHEAQPITYHSMRAAQRFARECGVEVGLYAAVLREDASAVPDGFGRLPDLERSAASVFPERTGRPLPFVQDILDRVRAHTAEEIVVLTNVDIALHPEFYVWASQHLASRGLKSCIVTRRDGLPKERDGRTVTPDDYEWLCGQPGVAHPGFDCFVMQRECLKQLRLADLFVGMPPWGKVLRDQLRRIGRFQLVTTGRNTFHCGSDRAWGSDRDLFKLNHANARAAQRR